MKTTKQIQSPHDMSLERNIPKQLIFEIRYQNQVNQVNKTLQNQKLVVCGGPRPHGATY
jgi:hypothetical protein